MNIKRWTVCLASHRWAKIRYPDADGPDGFFLRCSRCGYEKHDVGGTTSATGAPLGL